MLTPPLPVKGMGWGQEGTVGEKREGRREEEVRHTSFGCRFGIYERTFIKLVCKIAQDIVCLLYTSDAADE